MIIESIFCGGALAAVIASFVLTRMAAESARKSLDVAKETLLYLESMNRRVISLEQRVSRLETEKNIAIFSKPDPSPSTVEARKPQYALAPPPVPEIELELKRVNRQLSEVRTEISDQQKQIDRTKRAHGHDVVAKTIGESVVADIIDETDKTIGF